MRVTLVHPPITATNPRRLPQVQPPLGLAYLASSLREAGHQVAVVDGTGEAIGRFSRFRDGFYVHGLPVDEIVERIAADPEVIGVGVMFSNHWPLAKALLHAIRARHPRAVIVCGGEHVSACSEQVLRDAPVDFVVRGEGEETLLELLAALGDGGGAPDFADIDGLGYLDDARVLVSTAPRRRRRSLHDIPWPAWDLFPVEEYMDTRLYFSMPFDAHQRPMVILGTRGCPYACKFCSNEQMWGVNYFMREPADVVDEMESYVRRYGASDFHFQDLTFVISRRWVEALCRAIIDRGLEVTWKTASGTRSEALDADLARLMHVAGCDEIVLAPDSGSADIAASSRKDVDLEKLLAVAHDIGNQGLGVRLTGLMIVGYPEERLRDVLRTYAYLVRMVRAGFSTVYVNRFTAYPGSAYHDAALAAGRIRHDDDYFLNLERNFGLLNSGVSWHPRWSGRFVLGLWTLGYAIFFGAFYLTRPREIARLLSGVIRNRPRSRFERFFAYSLWQPLKGRRAGDDYVLPNRG